MGADGWGGEAATEAVQARQMTEAACDGAHTPKPEPNALRSLWLRGADLCGVCK